MRSKRLHKKNKKKSQSSHAHTHIYNQRTIMKDKNKIHKKIRYQSALTFQTRGQGYYIGSTLFRKITKFNPN
jgi:hypothetical protein